MKREAVTNDAVLKTVLLSDLVGSTKLVERLGDKRTAWLFARHDRLARDLMVQYGGLEIDKADGFLLLFERPLWAVRYALAYHEAIDKLGKDMNVELAARIGIHLGEVILRDNPSDDISRGAKPIEVEGLAKPIASRLMSLAKARQTLLSRSAFEIAYRAAAEMTEPVKTMRWLSHGAYRIQGVEMPVRIFEVGIEGFAPLEPPEDSDKGQRASGEMTLAVPLSGVPLIAPHQPATKRQRSEPNWPGDPLGDDLASSPKLAESQPHEIVAQMVAAMTAESERKADLERARSRRHLAAAMIAFLVLLAAALAFQSHRLSIAVERAAQEAERDDETLAEMRQLSRVVSELRADMTPPVTGSPQTRSPQTRSPQTRSPQTGSPQTPLFGPPAAATPQDGPETLQPALLLPAPGTETERDVIDLCRRLVERQDAASSLPRPSAIH